MRKEMDGFRQALVMVLALLAPAAAVEVTPSPSTLEAADYKRMTQPISDHVDLIEVNHHYDDEGKPRFDQIIFMIGLTDAPPLKFVRGD